jgi:hypothetical protein
VVGGRNNLASHILNTRSLAAIKMTVQQSKSIGGRQLIKAAVLLFAVYEISLLYKQTKGDFANGLLFFINEQANIFFIGFTVLYFLMMYLAGRIAGYNVLIKRRTGIQTILLYSFTTALLTGFLFGLAVTLILRREPQVEEQSEIVQLAFISFIVLFAAMLFVWSWAVNMIKRRGMRV